jgi:hypothetical protein
MTEQPTGRIQRDRRGHDFYPPAAEAASIPALYGTEDIPIGEKVLHLHYFAGACGWWVAEQVNVRSGLLIVERDLHWTPTRAARAGIPGRNAR